MYSPLFLNNNIGNYYQQLMGTQSVFPSASNNIWSGVPMPFSQYEMNSGYDAAFNLPDFRQYGVMPHPGTLVQTGYDLPASNSLFTSPFSTLTQPTMNQSSSNMMDSMMDMMIMMKMLEKLNGSGSSSNKTAVDDYKSAIDSDYNSSKGRKLAKAAKKVADDMPGTGYCARGVKRALVAAGLMDKYKSGHAYQVDEMLEKNDNFKEVKMEQEDLDELPAGSVVVWNKSSKKQWGHVSIALGNGKEASDYISDQKVDGSKYGKLRVFIPV